MEPTLSAFTVDVEDYFQVSAFEGTVRRDAWDRYECRVVANTRRVLRLLDRHDVRATFFVLGWVASRYPQLVREIDNAGHEIGSHSFWHRLIYRQTPEEFREDLRQSRDVLGNILGKPVTAFRAPSFSITAESLWALEILAEEGFQVDSSIFPINHDRYGIPSTERWPHRRETTFGSLWEVPPSVLRIASVSLPVAGGGYFRLYPAAWTLFCLRRFQRARRPFVFYIHPWEFDPDQPRIPVNSRLSRFRHYVNLSRTEAKVDRLLRAGLFGKLSEVLGQHQDNKSCEATFAGAAG